MVCKIQIYTHIYISPVNKVWKEWEGDGDCEKGAENVLLFWWCTDSERKPISPFLLKYLKVYQFYSKTFSQPLSLTQHHNAFLEYWHFAYQ